jgi:hypothetical protein
MCEEGKCTIWMALSKPPNACIFETLIPSFVLNHGQWLIWMIVGMIDLTLCKLINHDCKNHLYDIISHS